MEIEGIPTVDVREAFVQLRQVSKQLQNCVTAYIQSATLPVPTPLDTSFPEMDEGLVVVYEPYEIDRFEEEQVERFIAAEARVEILEEEKRLQLKYCENLEAELKVASEKQLVGQRKEAEQQVVIEQLREVLREHQEMVETMKETVRGYEGEVDRLAIQQRELKEVVKERMEESLRFQSYLKACVLHGKEVKRYVQALLEKQGRMEEEMGEKEMGIARLVAENEAAKMAQQTLQGQVKELQRVQQVYEVEQQSRYQQQVEMVEKMKDMERWNGEEGVEIQEEMWQERLEQVRVEMEHRIWEGEKEALEREEAGKVALKRMEEENEVLRQMNLEMEKEKVDLEDEVKGLQRESNEWRLQVAMLQRAQAKKQEEKVENSPLRLSSALDLQPRRNEKRLKS